MRVTQQVASLCMLKINVNWNKFIVEVIIDFFPGVGAFFTCICVCSPLMTSYKCFAPQRVASHIHDSITI